MATSSDPVGTGFVASLAAFAESAFYDDVLALHVPALSQPLLERLEEMRSHSRGGWLENADPGDLPRRLRAGGRQRRQDCEGQRGDEPQRRADERPHLAFKVRSS